MVQTETYNFFYLNRHNIVKILLVSSMLIQTVIMPQNIQADTITVRGDDWCPFNCDPTSGKQGFMVDVVKAILEPAGHTVDYQLLNWSRAIADSRAGTYTAIIGAAKADAEDFVFPESPLGSTETCVFVKSDNSFTYTSPDSLKGMKVGITKDYSYGEKLDAYKVANAQIFDEVGGEDPLGTHIKKLLAGRIQAFCDDKAVTQSALKESNLSQQIKNAGCEEQDFVFIAFSPKHPKAKEYAKLISDGIIKLRNSGELKKILEKYGVSDWQ